MPQNKSIELERIKQLVDRGEFEEALQLMDDFESRGENSLYDIISCHLLRCDLLYQQGLYQDAFQLAEQTYKESLGLGKGFLSIDSLILMANLLIYMDNIEKANELIKQAEEQLKTLTQENLKECKKREANIIYLKGEVFHPIVSPKSDVDLALKYFEESLPIFEKYGYKSEIAECLGSISFTVGVIKGDLNKGLDYIKRGMTLATESNRKYAIGWCLISKGSLYSFKGNIEAGVKFLKQSLSIFKELNNNKLVASILNNLGGIYKTIGDLDHALECVQQAVALSENSANLNTISGYYDYLIQILIEKGDLKRAEEYLNQVEQINEQLQRKETSHIMLFNKALILKTSPRAINRGKAEELLKQLLEMDPGYEFEIGALVNLCDLLLTELKLTNDIEVLQEVNSNIRRLIKIAEKSGSNQVLGEAFLLQAKLALILLDFKEARRLLTQGQKIAENFGLHSLAMKISNEHDQLLTQLKEWEEINERKTSLPERMELARLSEQMEDMVQKRVVEAPELSEEESILLLIVSEGGTPIFSKVFSEDQSFEDHLFGGFLSAINSFIDEMFSEGLDRASFGEHTLLMNSITPFFSCYIFKGQSYAAQQRIRYFLDKLKGNKEIWQVFEKYYQMNQEIQLRDIPSLEILIKEIFIDKTISLPISKY
jgi:tetratricopeptide (TPR) repeat protein